MRNELQRHKRSDKVKWVLTGIMFFLAFVMIAGLILQVFGTGKAKPSEWFKKSDSEQTEQLPAEGGENATAHTCVKAMAATYSIENNISTLSADSATQSVTIDNVVRLHIGDRVYANSQILVWFTEGDCVPRDGFCDCNHYIAIKDESGIAWTFYVDLGRYTSRLRVFKGGNLQSSVEVDLDCIVTPYGNCFPLSSYVDIPNGVIEDDDQLTYYSAVVQLPADPVKEGYTFVGWYYDSALTRPYNGEPISVDTQFYAKFEINTFTVTFNSGGGSEVASQTVNWNTAATLTTSTKKGYVFKGWFLSDGTEYTNQPITKNITLIAHWEAQTFTVTFYVDGEVYATKTVEYGQGLAKVAEAANLKMLSVRMASGAPTTDESGAVIVTEDCAVEAQEMSNTDKAINTVKNNKWAIIGGVAGGVALIAIIAVVCGGVKRKRRR